MNVSHSGSLLTLALAIATPGCGAPEDPSADRSIDEVVSASDIRGVLTSYGCLGGGGTAGPVACVALVNTDDGTTVAMLTKATTGLESKLAGATGKPIALPSTGIVPDWDRGLLARFTFDSALMWSGKLKPFASTRGPATACHVDMKSSQQTTIALKFQSRLDDHAKGGPAFEQYAAHGHLYVGYDAAKPSDTVVANLHAYCVSTRFPRSAAYAPPGARCSAYDVSGIALRYDPSSSTQFAASLPKPMLFERVDASTYSGEHVVYDAEVLVNGQAQWDPIGLRGSFRFDFAEAFAAQGRTCKADGSAP